MKTKLILALALSFFTFSSYSQGFEKPSEGKAVVYFVRWTNLGPIYNFTYFHNDKYIGEFKGKGYIRYECDPGKHIFWASSQNKQFVTAELESNKTYMIEVGVGIGGVLIYIPITNTKKLNFRKSKKTVLGKAQESFNQKELNEGQEKRKDLIIDQLKYYNDNITKKQPKFKTIYHFINYELKADMYIPESEMK